MKSKNPSTLFTEPNTQKWTTNQISTITAHTLHRRNQRHSQTEWICDVSLKRKPQVKNDAAFAVEFFFLFFVITLFHI